jgi:flagellar hook-associated protein 2
MGRITSSVGLASGVPIADTVDKLVALQTGPRDQLTASVKKQTAQQTAVTDILARLVALQLTADQLGNASTFNSLTAASSSADVLAATASTDAVAGTYLFTPVRKAQAQHVLSEGFASKTTTIGAGSLSFRHGGEIDGSTSLDQLNGGLGVPRGQIRITDRSGRTVDVDLRLARTVDDVLEAINNADVAVQATIDGDSIQLTDLSGETTANLRVQETAIGGKTAERLGLSTINVASDSATGLDIVKLDRNLSIERLNDGLGLRIDDTLADLRVSLRDGSTVDIDLHKAGTAAAHATATTTAASGLNGQVSFYAVQTGADFDNVSVEFVDDVNLNSGEATVSYSDIDPDHKKITVKIDSGSTTAAAVVAAVNANGQFNDVFTAAAGGDGTGVVASTDTGTTSGGAAIPAAQELTLGQVIDTINAADPTKLKVQIAADGDGLELIDLTTNAGHEFKVEDLFGSKLAEDLGLTGEADGDTIGGERILAGLNTVLLKSLNGGQGVGPLGDLSITDRNGASATVDLSHAETLADVLQLINDANVNVEANINNARNGISLVDVSGGTGSFIVADSDVTNSATKLKIAASVSGESIETGSLDRQTVGRTTKLSTLNGGNGISLGRIRIYDSAGLTNSLDLTNAKLKTVGDVIDAINALAVGVEARINDAGDGILLSDTADKAGQIKVEDLSGHAARDLQLLGTGHSIVVEGHEVSVIDASQTTKVEFDADDTLQDAADKINDRNAGVTASVLFDGSVYRLSLVTQRTGKDAAFIYDSSQAGFSLSETTKGQDALLLYGTGDSSTSVLASSATNSFTNLVDGLSLEVKGTTNESVTVNVAANDTTVGTRVKAFVDSYNSLRGKLNEYTSFDATTFQSGLLFGSGETLRVQADLNRILSGRLAGIGQVDSLARIGVTFKQDGTLDYNEDKLNAALQDDREAVSDFFSKEKDGFADKLHAVIESLAGRDKSLLVLRSEAYTRRIASDNERIATLNKRLDNVRERLLEQFERMEVSISKIKNNLSAISGIQPITSG